MPWRRTVSMWDETNSNRYLRFLETRPSDGLGDYEWPPEVFEVLEPPMGYRRKLSMSFDWSPKPFAEERVVRHFELSDKRAFLKV